MTLSDLRDHKIRYIFHQCNINIRLIGQGNKPLIIYKNRYVLSCSINQTTLYFTTSFEKGRVLFKVELMELKTADDKLIQKIQQWFSESVHKECFNIRIKESTLYLSGYNKQELIIDLNETVKKLYPVFSQHNYKLYFSKQYAQNILDAHSTKEIELEII